MSGAPGAAEAAVSKVNAVEVAATEALLALSASAIVTRTRAVVEYTPGAVEVAAHVAENVS